MKSSDVQAFDELGAKDEEMGWSRTLRRETMVQRGWAAVFHFLRWHIRRMDWAAAGTSGWVSQRPSKPAATLPCSPAVFTSKSPAWTVSLKKCPVPGGKVPAGRWSSSIHLVAGFSCCLHYLPALFHLRTPCSDSNNQLPDWVLSWI